MVFVGINAPTSQSFLNYVLLAIVYGSILLYRRKPLKVVLHASLRLPLLTIEFHLRNLYRTKILYAGVLLYTEAAHS